MISREFGRNKEPEGSGRESRIINPEPKKQKSTNYSFITNLHQYLRTNISTSTIISI